MTANKDTTEDSLRASLIERIRAADTITEQTHRAVIDVIESSQADHGFDARGRLKALVFDAREYDTRSLGEHIDDSRIALHQVASALSADTVETARGCKVVCVFVNDAGDSGVIRRLADLGVELIALRCTGHNNIDLDAAREHGLSVTNVPVYSPASVAEFTLGMMLNLNRKYHQAYLRNRAGHFVLDGLTGFDMNGKTVGIVGTGQIGGHLAGILLGLGCRVIAHDMREDDSLGSRPGFSYASLDEVLRDSDIISLHVPLFKETRHLVNANTISKMKPGVMLINTSRGGLVDTRALIEALKAGHIGSAGLDVYEEEAGIFFQDYSDRVLTDDVLARLLTFPNVVVTSHQAYLTREALGAIARSVMTTLDEFLDGRRGADLTNSVL